MCKGCDSATDIQFSDDLEEQIEAEMKLIAETMGVEVHSHSLEILGICRDCASDSTTCFCRGDNCESDT